MRDVFVFDFSIGMLNVTEKPFTARNYNNYRTKVKPTENGCLYNITNRMKVHLNVKKTTDLYIEYVKCGSS